MRSSTLMTIYSMIFILFFNSQQIQQRHQGVIALKNAGGGGASPDCTFYWSFESSGNITNETPAGYTLGGDSTPTSAGTISISNTQYDVGDSSAFLEVDIGSSYSFDADSDICSRDSGSVRIRVYFSAAIASARGIFQLQYNSANYIRLMTSGTDELQLTHRASGQVTLTTTGMNLTTSTWYTITCRWKVGGTNTLSVDVDGTEETSSTSLTAWSGDIATIVWGGDPGGAGAGEYYMDEAKVWDYWKD